MNSKVDERIVRLCHSCLRCLCAIQTIKIGVLESFCFQGLRVSTEVVTAIMSSCPTIRD
jgi:hypothetical protein